MFYFKKYLFILIFSQEISSSELQERLELVKKLKSELKNEEMALVLLKKLKQSQQLPREVTSLGGGATLTATKPPQKNDPKNLQRQNSTNDMLNSEKLVSYPLIITDVTFLL